METLRLGSKGADVNRWEYFMMGFGFYSGPVDGIYSDRLVEATKKFQSSVMLEDDGVVGPKTLAAAEQKKYPSKRILLAGGYPPKPAGVEAFGDEGRAKAFGAFKWVATPRPVNPEQIKVLDNWNAKNLVSINVPQFAQTPIGQSQGIRGVTLHRKVEAQFRAVWWVWEALKFLPYIKSFGGMLSQRLIRGSTRHLSGHAYGTAWDQNVAWNPLGHAPAVAGADGSNVLLVESACALGWFWGGWFENRKDGMHFEAYKVLSISDCVAAAASSGLSSDSVANLKRYLIETVS